MTRHFDTAVLPARPRKPRDKSKVERVVLIVERWLLGRLGHAGMARAFADLATNHEATSLSHAEWLALLLDHEATWRND